MSQSKDSMPTKSSQRSNRDGSENNKTKVNEEHDESQSSLYKMSSAVAGSESPGGQETTGDTSGQLSININGTTYQVKRFSVILRRCQVPNPRTLGFGKRNERNNDSSSDSSRSESEESSESEWSSEVETDSSNGTDYYSTWQRSPSMVDGGAFLKTEDEDFVPSTHCLNLKRRVPIQTRSTSAKAGTKGTKRRRTRLRSRSRRQKGTEGPHQVARNWAMKRKRNRIASESDDDGNETEPSSKTSTESERFLVPSLDSMALCKRNQAKYTRRYTERHNIDLSDPDYTVGDTGSDWPVPKKLTQKRPRSKVQESMEPEGSGACKHEYTPVFSDNSPESKRLHMKPPELSPIRSIVAYSDSSRDPPELVPEGDLTYSLLEEHKNGNTEEEELDPNKEQRTSAEANDTSFPLDERPMVVDVVAGSKEQSAAEVENKPAVTEEPSDLIITDVRSVPSILMDSIISDGTSEGSTVNNGNQCFGSLVDEVTTILEEEAASSLSGQDAFSTTAGHRHSQDLMRLQHTHQFTLSRIADGVMSKAPAFLSPNSASDDADPFAHQNHWISRQLSSSPALQIVKEINARICPLCFQTVACALFEPHGKHWHHQRGLPYPFIYNCHLCGSEAYFETFGTLVDHMDIRHGDVIAGAINSRANCPPFCPTESPSIEQARLPSLPRFNERAFESHIKRLVSSTEVAVTEAKERCRQLTNSQRGRKKKNKTNDTLPEPMALLSLALAPRTQTAATKALSIQIVLSLVCKWQIVQSLQHLNFSTKELTEEMVLVIKYEIGLACNKIFGFSQSQVTGAAPVIVPALKVTQFKQEIQNVVQKVVTAKRIKLSEMVASTGGPPQSHSTDHPTPFHLPATILPNCQNQPLGRSTWSSPHGLPNVTQQQFRESSPLFAQRNQSVEQDPASILDPAGVVDIQYGKSPPILIPLNTNNVVQNRSLQQSYRNVTPTQETHARHQSNVPLELSKSYMTHGRSGVGQNGLLEPPRQNSFFVQPKLAQIQDQTESHYHELSAWIMSRGQSNMFQNQVHSQCLDVPRLSVSHGPSNVEQSNMQTESGELSRFSVPHLPTFSVRYEPSDVPENHMSNQVRELPRLPISHARSNAAQSNIRTQSGALPRVSASRVPSNVARNHTHDQSGELPRLPVCHGSSNGTQSGIQAQSGELPGLSVYHGPGSTNVAQNHMQMQPCQLPRLAISRGPPKMGQSHVPSQPGESPRFFVFHAPPSLGRNEFCPSRHNRLFVQPTMAQSQEEYQSRQLPSIPSSPSAHDVTQVHMLTPVILATEMSASTVSPNVFQNQEEIQSSKVTRPPSAAIGEKIMELNFSLDREPFAKAVEPPNVGLNCPAEISTTEAPPPVAANPSTVLAVVPSAPSPRPKDDEDSDFEYFFCDKCDFEFLTEDEAKQHLFEDHGAQELQYFT